MAIKISKHRLHGSRWWWRSGATEVVSSGGGGAGGYRASGYGPSPLQGSAQELGLGTYAVTVGAGGTGSCCQLMWNKWIKFNFATITSAGGGRWTTYNTASSNGGSGGGGCNRMDLVLVDQVILLLQSTSRK